MSTQGIDELRKLGLTDLEARIYVHLLGTKASTGYAIAKAIARPVANVYKAVTTLEKKGAIYIQQGSNRLCSAVPAEELLDAMERNFKGNKEKAAKRLRQIGASQATNKVYSLNTSEQVYEKCISLIKGANQSILIDAFPKAIEPLVSYLSQAEKRGVQVSMQNYGVNHIPGVRMFLNPMGKKLRDKWSGQWLNLVVDGQSFIITYFSQDLNLVKESLWSSSPYISWIYYSALIAEMQLAAIKNKLHTDLTIAELTSSIHEMGAYFDTDASAINEYFQKSN
jgi:sugar-specific transcriptional regulator TrmB